MVGYLNSMNVSLMKTMNSVKENRMIDLMKNSAMENKMNDLKKFVKVYR